MTNLENAISNVAEILEKQVDEEITKLENLNLDDFQILRKERLKALKKQEQDKKKWLLLGHGEYTELPEEKCFIDLCKNSDRAVCHFYRDNAFRCKILDKHLEELARKHIETRFVKLNAPKCLFLAKRLKIIVIPTMLVIRGQQFVDRIEGFTDLGNRDDFDISMLEWRLARGDAILYDGDLYEPPEPNSKKKPSYFKNKTIRSQTDDDDDDCSD